jgi:S-DNA-T family DNA segregation ATPase FtsK/SpoIIIE
LVLGLALVVISVLFGFFCYFFARARWCGRLWIEFISTGLPGKTGTLLVLIFGLIIYVIFKIKVSPDRIKQFFENTKKELKSDLVDTGSDLKKCL